MANSNLHKAKRAKQDEFYTQLVDIEKEMAAYLEYNPDVFRGKTILLPCDDPEWSNFTKYFALRFEELGIKKLISTSFNGGGLGRIFVLDCANKAGDIEWDYLEGDGDFRSEEITKLRDEADMVITNPPFSLFREFVAWLIDGDVEFSIIGNKNAITYQEIFPLIKDNKLWLGRGFASGNAYFRIPEEMAREFAQGVYDEETHLVHFRNTDWFTNIEHGRRHEPLSLMTMEENERYNKKIIKNPNSYRPYDNYDAIEVPVTAGIPSDYTGVMGVPISFLDKYCPEQFEIVKFRHGDDGKDLGYTQENGEYKTPYFRILIRHIATARG